MNEFELSTLIVVGLLLLGVGGYSYAQIFRAQKQVKAKQQSQLSEGASVVPVIPERYHPQDSQVQPPMVDDDAEEEPMAETEPATVVSSSTVPEFEASVLESAVESVDDLVVEPVIVPLGAEEPIDGIDGVGAEVIGALSAKDAQATTDESETAAPTTVIETYTASESEPVTDVVPVVGCVLENNTSSTEPRAFGDAASVSETSPIATSAVVPTHAPITSMRELAERASWAVFAPWMRFESWLNTAYPEGVDVVHSIDGVIDITIAQPKVTQDIEQALFDLQLNTELPIHLYGARAGRVTMDANPATHFLQSTQRTRQWEQLEIGAPYSALRLSLQLANRSHCVDEHLLQDWFGLAEKLRKRLAGQLETLPDVTELADYARYLHGVARRLSQPIIVQLHKKNGLWPAYEIHQQLSACGAVLNEHGVYVVRDTALGGADKEQPRAPIYTVMNDVNNPRALDFFRDQMAMMHVHTVSFCLEFARVDGALMPLQRMCEDARQVADALDAQWQNGVGDVISPEALFECMDARTQAFNELLKTLGLPAGALMTKRLLAQ